MENKDIIDADYTENLPAVIEDDPDFEYTQKNIRKIIDESMEVLKKSAELVEASDHPDYIIAYTHLIKNISQLNKDLLLLKESKNKITSNPFDPSNSITIPSSVTTNNAIFVGSTEELLKHIKSIK